MILRERDNYVLLSCNVLIMIIIKEINKSVIYNYRFFIFVHTIYIVKLHSPISLLSFNHLHFSLGWCFMLYWNFTSAKLITTPIKNCTLDNTCAQSVVTIHKTCTCSMYLMCIVQIFFFQGCVKIGSTCMDQEGGPWVNMLIWRSDSHGHPPIYF